jgi:hypothetical protein
MRHSLAAVLVVGLIVVALPAAPEKSPSVKPVNVAVNTDQDEDDPHLSYDALHLYYTSTAKGKSAVMVAERRTGTQPWPAGKPLADLEGKPDCRGAFVTPEGKYPQYLYFATNKDPEKEDARGSNFDIYYVARQLPKSDFTSPTPVHPVCTEADELHPWLTRDGRTLYFSRKDRNGWHVYAASRPQGGGQFGKPERVKLPDGFHHATLTPDGKVMYVQGPLENERSGLFRCVNKGGTWMEPEPLDELNSPDAPTGDRSPSLSRDGSLLYFASDRAGGKGGLDLWVIQVAQLGHKPK